MVRGIYDEILQRPHGLGSSPQFPVTRHHVYFYLAYTISRNIMFYPPLLGTSSQLFLICSKSISTYMHYTKTSVFAPVAYTRTSTRHNTVAFDSASAHLFINTQLHALQVIQSRKQHSTGFRRFKKLSRTSRPPCHTTPCIPFLTLQPCYRPEKPLAYVSPKSQLP